MTNFEQSAASVLSEVAIWFAAHRDLIEPSRRRLLKERNEFDAFIRPKPGSCVLGLPSEVRAKLSQLKSSDIATNVNREALLFDDQSGCLWYQIKEKDLPILQPTSKPSFLCLNKKGQDNERFLLL